MTPLNPAPAPLARLAIAVLCGASFALAAGCGGPSYHGGELPSPSVPTYGIQSDVGVQPASTPAFSISASTGNVFRITWAALPGVANHFTGSVWTTGTFAKVYPGCSDGICPLGGSSWVSKIYPVSGGNRIDLDATTRSALEGFDVQASTSTLYFNLLIDGVPDPQGVFFTASATQSVATVESFPFALTLM